MKSGRRKNYKNKLWIGSKISQYKTEKALQCFSEQMTVKETSAKTGISQTTIKGMFFRFRKTMFYASLGYSKLFNGAGLLIALGMPPQAQELEKKANDRRNGKSDQRNWYFWEEAIRSYSGYVFTNTQKALISWLGIMLAAKKRSILVEELLQLPKCLDLIPERPQQKVKIEELNTIKSLAMETDDFIVDLWRSNLNNKFKVPDYIWSYMFEGRQTNTSSKLIYRDLRWYLLKHPVNDNNASLSKYWDDYPSPDTREFIVELKKLITFAINDNQ